MKLSNEVLRFLDIGYTEKNKKKHAGGKNDR